MAHWLIRLVPLAIVGASIGCGGSDTKAVSPTETTGAMATPEAQSNMVQLQKERDDAQRALAEERAGREQDRQRNDLEASERKARDEISVRIIRAVDSANAEMMGIKEKSAKATPKQKKDMEQAMEEAKSKKAKLMTDLQRAHGDLGANMDSFKTEVEADIADLDRVVIQLREGQPGALPPAGKAKTGAPPKGGEMQKGTTTPPKGGEMKGTNPPPPKGDMQKGNPPPGGTP